MFQNTGKRVELSCVLVEFVIGIDRCGYELLICSAEGVKTRLGMV